MLLGWLYLLLGLVLFCIVGMFGSLQELFFLMFGLACCTIPTVGKSIGDFVVAHGSARLFPWLGLSTLFPGFLFGLACLCDLGLVSLVGLLINLVFASCQLGLLNLGWSANCLTFRLGSLV